MNWEKAAEEAIRKSIENGEFNDLPGKGEPLNLDDYFAAPEEWRASFSLLRNANVLPEMLDLHCDVQRLKERLEKTTDPEEQRELRRKVNEQETKLNLEKELFRRKR